MPAYEAIPNNDMASVVVLAIMRCLNDILEFLPTELEHALPYTGGRKGTPVVL